MLSRRRLAEADASHRHPYLPFVTSVRCFLRFAFLARKHASTLKNSILLCDLWPLCDAFPAPVSPEADASTKSSSSVASVTSLRCFPRCACSRTEARVHQSVPLTPFPLCGLLTSVRCFPLFAFFSHRKPPRSPKALHPQSPSVTSVTSVRCFPRVACFSPGSSTSTEAYHSHPPP